MNGVATVSGTRFKTASHVSTEMPYAATPARNIGLVRSVAGREGSAPRSAAPRKRSCAPPFKTSVSNVKTSDSGGKRLESYAPMRETQTSGAALLGGRLRLTGECAPEMADGALQESGVDVRVGNF